MHLLLRGLRTTRFSAVRPLHASRRGGERAGIRESDVRDAVSRVVRGSTEQCTPVGYIDVLTDTEVIEVKNFRSWKHALGQVLAYGSFHEGKSKRIHLYATEHDAGRARAVSETAAAICAAHGVTVTLDIVPDPLPSVRL